MRKVIVVLVVFCVGVGVGTALAQRAKDATQVDPEVHHVVMENDHVRVLEVRAPVGYKSPMHSHPPLLGVSIGAVRLRVTSPDGQKQIMDLRPGQIFWLDGAEHSWELLAGNHHVVAVEVKAANKPAAK
jgi:hypothetical protein